jgi:hypothetical protein
MARVAYLRPARGVDARGGHDMAGHFRE